MKLSIASITIAAACAKANGDVNLRRATPIESIVTNGSGKVVLESDSDELGSAVGKGPTLTESGEYGDCQELQDVEWHLKVSKVPEAWEYSRSMNKTDQGEGIVIASPDTGYHEHPFSHGIYNSQGHNWMASWSNDEDENNAIDNMYVASIDAMSNPGHGTMVSAIMAGTGEEADNYGFTIRGAAPKAKVLPLRMVTSVVFFYLSNLREAIYYAKDNGAHIVSTSLGTPTHGMFTWRWKAAVMDAIRNNIILVTAGGQYFAEDVMGTNNILPASYHNVIAVGAVDPNKEFWHEEGYTGSDIAWSAGGVDVCVASGLEEGLEGESSKGSGTSFSTALTAGVAALWLAHHGREELISIAEGRGEYLQHLFCKAAEASVEVQDNWDVDMIGAGILDAEALLMLDLSSLPLGDTLKCQIDV